MKVHVDFIPFSIDTLKQIDKGATIKIESQRAAMENFVPLVDRESRYKRILGTMGKNINRSEEDVRSKTKRE